MKAEEIHHGPGTLRLDQSYSVGVPLFHATWLFALGIVIAHNVWLRPSYLLLALAPLAILCGICAFRAQRISWLPLAVLWCVLGAWCAEVQPQPAPEPALAALSDGLTRTIEGDVTDAGPVRSDLDDAIDNPAEEPTQRIDIHLRTVEVVSDTEDAQKPIARPLRIEPSDDGARRRRDRRHRRSASRKDNPSVSDRNP